MVALSSWLGRPVLVVVAIALGLTVSTEVSQISRLSLRNARACRVLLVNGHTLCWIKLVVFQSSGVVRSHLYQM